MRALRSHGVTLVELLIVVSILGIFALVAIPNLSSGGAKRLDVATAEVVAALRYARSEAMRSGEVHGIKVNHDRDKVEVYKADLSTDPVSIGELLTHPVDHKPYVFDFDTAQMTLGVSISNNDDSFRYRGDTDRNKNLLFDASGTPIWIDTDNGETYALRYGKIKLSYNELERTVWVAAVTGRVTVE